MALWTHGWGGELIDPEPAKSKLYQLSLADGSTPDQLSQGLEVCMPDGTLIRGKQASELGQLQSSCRPVPRTADRVLMIP